MPSFPDTFCIQYAGDNDSFSCVMQPRDDAHQCWLHPDAMPMPGDTFMVTFIMKEPFVNYGTPNMFWYDITFTRIKHPNFVIPTSTEKT